MPEINLCYPIYFKVKNLKNEKLHFASCMFSTAIMHSIDGGYFSPCYATIGDGFRENQVAQTLLTASSKDR